MAEIALNLGDFVSGHDLDMRRLTAAFFAEDDIGVITRCHFELERAATRSLNALTDGRWKKARSRYLNDKLNLLEVLGTPPKLLSPARTLNNQRNEFAHDGIEELSEQMLLDVQRGIPAFYPQFDGYSTIVIRGRREFSGEISACTVRQQYSVTTSILAMLVGSIPEMFAKAKAVD